MNSVKPVSNIEREAGMLIGLLTSVIKKYQNPRFEDFHDEHRIVERIVYQTREDFIHRLAAEKIDPRC